MNKRTLCLRTTANLRRHWAKHGTYSMTINEQAENGLGPDLLKVSGSEDAEHTAAELVKRWNAYPHMFEKLRDSLNYIPTDGDAERDLREAIEDLLNTL